MTGASYLCSKTYPAWAKEAAYDKLAADYDSLDGGAVPAILGLTELRERVVSMASGRVLEVGIGTGLNLEWYSPQKVSHLTGLDVSSGMLNVARRKSASLTWGDRVDFVQEEVTNLPFENRSFDCVVDTYSLCVYPDPTGALQEMARVVKPDGRVLLLEHTRSSNAAIGLYQDIVAEPVAATSKGCVWNQDVLSLMRGAGLKPLNVVKGVGGLVSLIVAVPATVG
ncbi:hypothetical protein BSKO_08016 [Bryopsis sp. KO-2023]|nr:hypothetical protein BSKO_08016 [Bryopsis sp. KO-2023]